MMSPDANENAGLDASRGLDVGPEDTVPAGPAPTGTLPDTAALHMLDLMLAAGLVVLAFGLASFAARNSDLWLHLGTGRLIASGNLEFGKDPFSYTTRDRLWINHSWLSDLALYQLFQSLGGRGLVFVKAGLVAAAALLLLLACRAARGRWLACVCITLALLTSAVTLQLRPFLVSIAFVALTMFWLVGVRVRPRSWAWVGAVATTFALWANCDEWFFLGPAMLGLSLLGAVLQSKLRPGDSEAPALSTLAIGLVVGTAVCLLNPYHVRIWQLPPEIFPNAETALLGKERVFEAMFHSIWNSSLVDFNGSRGGNPVNALAFVSLVGLLIIGFALNYRSFSYPLLLINAAFLLLAVYNARAAAFFAMAAAPTAALNIGAWLDRKRGQVYELRTLRLLAGLRVGLRIVLILLGLAAIVACYPGWLQPFSQQRRLAWDVEPDQELVKTAEMLQHWREDGRIPAAARSLIFSIPLADYCAWYAPDEKTFIDSRIALHGPQAEAFMKLRGHFMRRPGVEPSEPFDPEPLLQAKDIAFVVLGSNNSVESIVSYDILLRTTKRNSYQWELWALNGHYSVFGWRGQSVMTVKQFQAMRFDAIGLAYGKDCQPIASEDSLRPPTPRDLEEKFLRPLPSSPEAGDEVTLLLDYFEFLNEPGWRYERRRAVFLAALATAGGPAAAALGAPSPPTLSNQLSALPVLAVRTGRRAILESPESPVGYLRLAQAFLRTNFEGALPNQRDLIITSTLERYFARATLEQLVADQSSFQAALMLFSLHFNGHQNQNPAALRANNIAFRGDLGLAAAKKARLILASSAHLHGEERVRNELKQLDALIQHWEEELRNQENRWFNAVAGLPPLERAIAAQGFWLSQRSLEEMKKLDLTDEKLVPEQRAAAMLNLAQLYSVTGQAELAALQVDAALKTLEAIPEIQGRPELRPLIFAAREWQKTVAYILGRFSELEELMLRTAAERQFIVDRLRREELPFAAAAWTARRLASTNALAARLQDIRAHLLGLEREPPAQSKLNPIFQPLPEEGVLNAYRNQQWLEAEAHFQLGMVFLEQGDTVQAAKQFRQVLQAIPAATPTPLRSNATGYLKLMQNR